MMVDAGPPKPAFGVYGALTGAPTRPAPVLVIDDQVEGSAATVSKLADAGYPTTAESDGDAVLRLVRSAVTRLVVSALYIPREVRRLEGRDDRTPGSDSGPGGEDRDP